MLTKELMDLFERVERFQDSRFPNQTLDSKLKHMIREIEELRTKAKRQLFSLIIAAHEKLTICEARQWGQPDADGIYHHVALSPAASVTDFDLSTIMAHKLAAMRLHKPNLTKTAAVVRIVAVCELEPTADRVYFEQYVTRRVNELWDGSAPTN